MKYFIFEAVNEEWISEIEDEVMEFTNKIPIEMLDHIEKRGGTLDYFNRNEIKKDRNAPWDTTEQFVA